MIEGAARSPGTNFLLKDVPASWWVAEDTIPVRTVHIGTLYVDVLVEAKPAKSTMRELVLLTDFFTSKHIVNLHGENLK